MNFETPLFIGGVGGSGTRVVCSIAIDAGYFMGKNLNVSLDSLDFQPFYDNSIRKYLEQENSHFLQNELKQTFLDCVKKQNENNNSINWGSKNPRFILVLPFLFSLYPKMKFIHVIRDGRDMIFSSNQNQPKLYGDIFVKDLTPEDPLYSLRYWCVVNQLATEYGKKNLKENYLLIRYEDLLENPTETTKTIFNFLGSSNKINSDTIEKIKTPPSIGRWKTHKDKLTFIPQYEEQILKNFGYF